jgi:predicted outer membrane lipoprotein
MAAFLAVVVLGRPASPDRDDAELATGAKFALIPILVMASLSATSVGFGLMPACLFGVIGAMAWPRAQASARGATPARSRRAPVHDLQGENP